MKTDLAKAVQLYQLAVDRGNTAAPYNLGLLYVKGHGVRKDPAKGMSLFRKGAELGDADSMYEIGFAYDMGWGVTIDYTESAKWIAKAIASGSDFALKEMTGKFNKWELPFRIALQKELVSRGVYKGPTDGAWNDGMQGALTKLAGGA